MATRLPVRPRPRPGAGARRTAPARAAVWLLALESADLSTVGAVGRDIETSSGLSHAELGLLAATSLAGRRGYPRDAARASRADSGR